MEKTDKMPHNNPILTAVKNKYSTICLWLIKIPKQSESISFLARLFVSDKNGTLHLAIRENSMTPAVIAKTEPKKQTSILDQT